MHELSIKIPKKFFGLPWHRLIKGEFAEEWNEFTARQLIGIVKALHTTTDKYLFRAFSIGAILGIKRWRMKMFSAELMIQLWWLFDFIEKDNTLTKNLLPVLRVRTGWFRWQRLYGPGDKLQFVNALEWSWIEKFYDDFHEGGDVADLRRMVACMYRPKTSKGEFDPNYNGDARHPFNVNTIDKYVEALKQVNLYKLLAIMLWYQGCKMAIAKSPEFDKVFTRDSEDPESYGWPEVYMKIAKDGVFGDINQVHAEQMTTILLHMQINAKDFEKMKKEREKHEARSSK